MYKSQGAGVGHRRTLVREAVVADEEILSLLELELIQSHMAQKPMLRGEVGARALRVRSDVRGHGPIYISQQSVGLDRSICQRLDNGIPTRCKVLSRVRRAARSAQSKLPYCQEW